MGCFRNAKGNPGALRRCTCCLLKELARRTYLKITDDSQIGKCLHRPGMIAEKVLITMSDWEPDPKQNPGQRLWVELWPAGTVVQADCFYRKVSRKDFLALNKQGWQIKPNPGFHFAQRPTPLFKPGASLDAREHLEYFFSGERPYGRYHFPDGGRGGRRELTPDLIKKWRRYGIIDAEAQNKIKDHNKTYQSIDLKPGFWVYRIWELNEVIKLQRQGVLEARIIQALAIPLQTWGEILTGKAT